MKFMKLGSKPDSFMTDGDNIRYVATELSTDIVINVGDVKFYLHKFPLLSKSARLQKLVSITDHDTDSNDEIHISDIPGGPAAFEICAKFCYGITVTLNAYNVVGARCAAEYLEMYETSDKGNLVYKIDVFLSSSIFRSWKDSIIVLQSTKPLLLWSEELKVVSHCLDSIASKASIDTSRVEWSFTYNRKNGNNGLRKQLTVPKDWWVEDLCELHIDLYKRVIMTIQTNGSVSDDVIGEALKAYVFKRLPGFKNGVIQGGDLTKYRYLVNTIISMLPTWRKTVGFGFLIRLLQASVILGCDERERERLMRGISRQLDEASVSDLLIRAPPGEPTMCNVDVVRDLVERFAMGEQNEDDGEFEEMCPVFVVSDDSKVRVSKLVDGYLTEIGRDPNLPLAKFVDLAEIVSGFPRTTHDGLYRAIDMYLREHPGISKSERKRICRLMDCKKLSADACSHAIQNERLPLRIVVQVLFFEQARAAAATATSSSGGGSTPELPASLRASSRSTTTTTNAEDWDAVATSDELKALKGELAGLKIGNGGGKAKIPVMSKKIFSKLWSSKERVSENSSSDTSGSPGSLNAGETKSTRSRSRRYSLS